MSEEMKGCVALYKNKYQKLEKHPFITGNGRIHIDRVREMMAWYDEHKPEDGMIRLDSAGFKKVDREGKDYIFVIFSPYEPRESRPAARIPSHDEEIDIPF